MVSALKAKYNTVKNIIDKIDDFLNPIVVKEIRQSINSSGVMVLTLLILILEVSAFLLSFGYGDTEFGTGSVFYAIILAIFVFGYTIGISGVVATRITKEYANNDSTDLIYTTTISSYRIISGKLFSAMVLVFYLLSLCLPFFAISYFLKGIALNTIINITFFAFFVAVPYILLVILVSVSPMHKAIKVIVMLGAIAVVAIFTIWLISYIERAITFSWESLFCVIYLATVFSGLFYFLTVGLLSHLTANRTFGLKVFYSLFFIVSYVIVFAGYMFSKMFALFVKPIDIYHVAMIILMLIVLFNSFERTEQTKRVLLANPKNIILRFFHYIFSIGMANNTLFLILCFTGINSLLLCMFKIYPKVQITSDDVYSYKFITTIFFYLFAYQLAALILKRNCNKYFSKASVFSYFAFLNLFFMLGSMVIAFILKNILKIKAFALIDYIFIFSPLILWQRTNIDIAFVVSMTLCFIGLCFNLKYFFKCFKEGMKYYREGAGNGKKSK
ncbi:hypothetical protein AAEX28_03010 [Lentisphaerota bacterium WC36G]|nr:hypothetical protein LJT99_05890 [Lentisphaerae bacterium WC36]